MTRAFKKLTYTKLLAQKHLKIRLFTHFSTLFRIFFLPTFIFKNGLLPTFFGLILCTKLSRPIQRKLPTFILFKNGQNPSKIDPIIQVCNSLKRHTCRDHNANCRSQSTMSVYLRHEDDLQPSRQLHHYNEYYTLSIYRLFD